MKQEVWAIKRNDGLYLSIFSNDHVFEADFDEELKDAMFEHTEDDAKFLAELYHVKDYKPIKVRIEEIEEPDWTPCFYKNLKFYGGNDFIDGRWYEFKDKFGNIEKARVKLDAIDHFSPNTNIIEEENIVAYRELNKEQ